MTFAIVRDGVIRDHVAAGSLRELAPWARDRAGDVVVLDLAPGEAVRVGARVDVDEVVLGIARLAR